MKKKSCVIITIIAALLLILPVSFAQVSMLSSSTDMGYPTSNVVVTFIGQDPDPVEPGEWFELRWKVENYGSDTIHNLRFNLSLDYPFSFYSNKDQVQIVGALDPRQKDEKGAIIKWKVRADDNAVEGTNEVDLTYALGRSVVKLDPFMISVKSRDFLISINSIEVIPKQPAPGQEVDVNINLENLADTYVSEVQVKLDLTEMPLSPMGSTSEKAIKKILSGEQKDITFKLAINSDAESKVHNIPLIISYKDKFGEMKEIRTVYGLPIYSSPEYILNMEESTVHTAKTKGSVVVSLSNIGKGPINFATLEMLPSPDYEIISAPKIYLGNLESDDFETSTFDLFINKPDKDAVDLRYKVTFKDSYNKDYTEEQIVPLKIYSGSQAKKFGFIKASSTPFIIFMIVVIAGAGYYYYVKRKKKKVK